AQPDQGDARACTVLIKPCTCAWSAIVAIEVVVPSPSRIRTPRRGSPPRASPPRGRRAGRPRRARTAGPDDRDHGRGSPPPPDRTTPGARCGAAPVPPPSERPEAVPLPVASPQQRPVAGRADLVGPGRIPTRA